MKFKIVSSKGCRRLALIFVGWGMDYRPFDRLARDGYDIAVVWDYRTLDASWTSELSVYEEIALFAWSFGVPAAASFKFRNPELPVTVSVAVNGTMHPVNNQFGIPEAIFQGTLDSLDERNLMKFYRRMCGCNDLFKRFSEHLPMRDITGLKDELVAISARKQEYSFLWDKAVISDSDRIVPPDNQRSAWENEACVIMNVEGPHMPDFSLLLETCLTDKDLVERKFQGAADTYEENAVVQRTIVDRMLMNPGIRGRILEIGSGTGYATSRLMELGDVEAWDLTLSTTVTRLAASGKITARACDAETSIKKVPDGSIDILFSASTVQWFNSLPAFLREVRRVLSPGGKAIISTFGPDTMKEIHETCGTKPRFPDAEAIRRMIPEAKIEEEIVTLEFATPIDVLNHTRLTGVNSLGRKYSPAMIRRLLSSYPLTEDARHLLTYSTYIITFEK